MDPRTERMLWHVCQEPAPGEWDGGCLYVVAKTPLSGLGIAHNATAKPYRWTLDALVADSRGVPPIRTAEELTAELRNGGFEDVQMAGSPIGRLVMGRRGD